MRVAFKPSRKSTEEDIVRSDKTDRREDNKRVFNDVESFLGGVVVKWQPHTKTNDEG